MCGICGIFGKEDRPLIRKMMSVLAHRGPDSKGIFSDKNITLGHRRLSIIDLSKKASQPMQNKDGTMWIVYNGEVYNFKKLRKQLKDKGHDFFSRSDSEVVLHAYEEYGTSCLDMLNGEFAFAVYDSGKKRLMLARDRMGVKPLYYTLHENNLIFSSEIKAILQYEEIKREINPVALCAVLSLRYTPFELCMIKNIKKLLPGHYMLAHENGIKIKKYFTLNYEEKSRSEQYYIKEFRKNLSESVETRLMSDVPLGALLSGGLDSSAIVAIMSRLCDNSVKTFTVGFGGEERLDETKYARMISERFSTDHTEVFVKPDVAKLLPRVIWHLDEPVSTPTTVLSHIVCEVARRKVKTVLAGEGSDESIAGYPKFKVLQGYKRFGKVIPQPILSGASMIPATLKSKFGESILLTELIASGKDDLKSYLAVSSHFTKHEKTLLFSNSFLKKIQNPQPEYALMKKYIKPAGGPVLNNMLKIDSRTWLVDDILLTLDKMGMANSLEARVPFLDNRMIDLYSEMPSNLKLKGSTDKYILRRSLKGILPPQILKREKHGFTAPIDKWVQEHFSTISQTLEPRNIRKRAFFKSHGVRKILALSRQRNRLFPKSKYYLRQVWDLFTLELWFRIFIDQDRLSKPNLQFDRLLT